MTSLKRRAKESKRGRCGDAPNSLSDYYGPRKAHTFSIGINVTRSPLTRRSTPASGGKKYEISLFIPIWYVHYSFYYWEYLATFFMVELNESDSRKCVSVSMLNWSIFSSLPRSRVFVPLRRRFFAPQSVMAFGALGSCLISCGRLMMIKKEIDWMWSVVAKECI